MTDFYSEVMRHEPSLYAHIIQVSYKQAQVKVVPKMSSPIQRELK